MIIIDDMEYEEEKKKKIVQKLEKIGIENEIIIGGEEIDEKLKREDQNIKKIDVMKVKGINV